ncbi:unnamed protein product, partial [Closterium sp. NIES-53]
SRGGQQQPLPHLDTLSPLQICEWVVQRARAGGGGFGFMYTGQRRQRRQQETFSLQRLPECVSQRGVPGCVEAAALGASESAVALGASESAAALGASASTATGPTSAEALHTFTLVSGASRCFFCDCTTVTLLTAPVPVSLADPTGGPIIARASTVLSCPAAPSGSLAGLHLPRSLHTWGGEFSSGLLAEFCRDQGIRQTFTLPASPQQNVIAECRIGLVMEVARTSIIHTVALHFLWSFAVRYAAHQLNLWPRVSLSETSPTLRWTGEVGDESEFRVWGALSLVRNTTASKLSPRTLRCDFLGFPTDAPPWQFYHPRSRHTPSPHRVLLPQ